MSEDHELHVTHDDVHYFCSEKHMGTTEDVTFKVVNWLLNKHECYGRVWRDRGSWERAKKIERGTNDDIREWVEKCFETVDRFTTPEEALSFHASGGDRCRIYSPFPMKERKAYIEYLKECLAQTPRD